MPYLVLGALLVVLCAGGAVITVLEGGHRQSVLALVHDVAVGDLLHAQDVRQVSVSVDADMDVVPADREAAVLGQPLAYSLPAGTLLSSKAFGAAQLPEPGQALVAVFVKPGQYPPQLNSGAPVSVILSAGTNGSGQPSSGGPWPATVVTVEPSTSDQASVVALQMPVASALQVAALPAGEVSLVALPIGGR
ncbi:hypothetical protein GCM10023214_45670 [Amycolatopsis dongchuanensis]|uniref:SAF domain-containing protein n=1 Tax=Amycolatopsis dongchuanensis TaxID=1070866 RepID=A0ABP9QXW2_9PSEU